MKLEDINEDLLLEVRPNMAMPGVLALAMLAGRAQAAHTFDQVLDAIRQVETGGLPNNGEGAKGDNGKALGPFQIWHNYWADAVAFDKSIGGKYEDCTNLDYSLKVVRAYLKRYAGQAIASGDWATVCRIHNGGPKGATNKATLQYWAKVQKLLNK